MIHGDGVDYMERTAHKQSCAIFTDPPYAVAGRRLYRHSEVDNRRILSILKKLSNDFLVTYDDSSEIRALTVEFQLDCETVAMKNTHHSCMTELLIGKNLDWLRLTTSAR